ncbi:hypothetical protein SAY86_009600 [Trapa natans]|uniref:Uncharacterized protein n=1 Tax=Trapa natans TaxID=22666 RepID=A0AAN7QT59_TRANT|nr:hypothetical protein SAY86_009600 [Trapa natans]
MKLKITRLTITAAFFCWFMVFPSQFFSYVGADNGAHHHPDKSKQVEEAPSLAEIVMDTISMMKSPNKISWDKVKTILNKVQIRLSPPSLDFRGLSNKASPVEEIKEAAGESFKSGKSTVEESAKSAAEAVQRTAEKVKENISDKEEGKVEL